MSERIYHVWFGTKKRIAALQGDIGSDIKQLLVEIAREVGIGLMEMETSADHMHLVIRVSEDRTLSWVMHQLKGASSRSILLKYPELRIDMAQQGFWQKGYGYRRLERTELPAVRNYVRSQEKRPLRHE